MDKPQVHIFALGGTIAMMPGADDGARPALSAADLVAAVPGIDKLGDIYTHDFRNVASANLTFADLIELARKIEGIFAGGGRVVVTQGTDSLEESAFALDIMSATGAVVFTGAMRNPGLEGSDGPANLLDAVRVATGFTGTLTGAVVVMNGEVHAAKEVRKLHTSDLGAFASASGHPLARIAEGRIAWEGLAGGTPKIHPDSICGPARVAYYSAVLDDGSESLQSIAEGDYDGLVVAAFGGGHMPETAVDVLAAMARKIPVILASRVGVGRVLEDVYGYPGSEIDLISKGLIPARNLDPRKSRVLLTLALRAGWSRAEISSAFDKF